MLGLSILRRFLRRTCSDETQISQSESSAEPITDQPGIPDETQISQLESSAEPRTDQSEIDLLASTETHIFHFELTSRCNLRCVYCAQRQPEYIGRDMEVSDFDLLVQQLKDRHITILALNGHGETTALQGWDQRVISVADAGLRMSITSNFARLLNENELAAMARIGDITISVDTHRKDLLRDLRRNVDLGNILINMHAVAATASKLGLPSPAFSWSCVVSDRVALDLVDYIHFGLACGVRNFVLCNLTVLVEGAANARHVSTLSVAVLRRFSELLSEAEVISKNAGASLLIEAGLVDSVRQMLSNGTSVGHELIHWQVKGGTRYAASATSDKPTRDCLDPWFFAYLDSGRGLHPCCFHPPIGTLEIGGSLDVLLNGPTVRDLRNQLLTGQLSDLCQQCPGKPLASIDTLRMHLLEELAREQNATTT